MQKERVQQKQNNTTLHASAESESHTQESGQSFAPPALQFKAETTEEESSIIDKNTFAGRALAPPPLPPASTNNSSETKTPFKLEEDTTVQKKNSNQSSGTITPYQFKKSNSSSALPEDVRGKMETAFQADFSNVNIHTNSQSATDVGALAYTQGDAVHFAPGQFKPETQSGQELIGHELTHVVQQRQGRVQPTTNVNGMPVNDNAGLETEADSLGKKAASTKAPTPIVDTPAPTQMKGNEVSQRLVPTGPMPGVSLFQSLFNARQTHYNRNDSNQAPTQEPVDNSDWIRLSDGKSIYHQNGEEGRNNRKYVSANGGNHEAVYNENGELVTDSANLGTYNFAGPEDAPVGHFFKDVIPYWLWGNSEDDTTPLMNRLAGPRIMERLGGAVSGAASSAWSGISSLWGGGQSEEAVQQKANPTSSKGVIQGWGIPDWMKSAGSAVMGAAQNVGSAVKKSGSSVFEAVKHVGTGALDSVMSVGGGLLDGAKSVGSGLLNGATSIGGGLLDGAKSIGNGVLDGLSSAGNGIWDGLQSAGSGLAQGGGQIWDGIQSGAGNLLSNPLEALSTMGGGLLDGLGTMGGGLWDGLTNAGGGLLDGAMNIGGGLLDGIGNIGGGLLEGIGNIGGGLWDGLKDVGGGLLSGAGDLLGGGLKGLYGLFDAVMELGPGMLENFIGPNSKEASAKDVPAYHVMMEYMAHNVAYAPNVLKDKNQSKPLTLAGYDINNYSVRVGPKGFQAVLLRPLPDRPDVRPVLAFRGTLSAQGVSTDLDVRQVGQQEYQQNLDEINQLVDGQGQMDVTGHSLGGAMAQIFTARNPGLVRHLVTFQSPGISAGEVAQGEQRINDRTEQGLSTPTVAHHIVDNDLVDTAGERNLPGQVFEHRIDDSYNVVDSHTSVIFLSPEFADARAQYGITDDVVKQAGWELRDRNAEITEFDGHPNVVRRVLFEGIRKALGFNTAPLRGFLSAIGFEYDFGGVEYQDSDNQIRTR